MTRDQIMEELERLGSAKVREMNARHGVGENQFGVKMGDIRNLANHFHPREGRRFPSYPTSKGCTSPFVPIWIREVLGRQGVAA